ncbi:MAG: phosphatase PAP2 family protein [Proteobacteria bacterium]|nr:phosphatase PAP2 family protein [Pseudomonadota bacterium]
MDAAVTQWINAAAGQFGLLDAFAIALTRFGVPVLVLLVAAQWWTRRDRAHVRHACAAAGLSFALGLAINQAVLLFIHRVRPYDAGVTHLLIDRSADWSFPSDHATATFAIAAAFVLASVPVRGLLFLAGALLVCWSRVFVGTHYVTDVLGGAMTGTLAAILVRGVYREGSRIDGLVTGIL